MAQYRCSVKPNLTRSGGGSMANKAAYILRARMHDARLDKTFSYAHHSSKALFTGVYVPASAPQWAHDPQQLVNAIEAAENRCDAQLARPLELNLPHEFTLEQNRWLLQDYIKENFTRKGYAVLAAIHEPDNDSDARNVHAHLLVSLRTIDENGFAKSKAQEQDNYRNKSQVAAALRASWANLGARHLTRHGLKQEADRWAKGDLDLPKQRAAALERGDTEFAARCDHEPDKHLGVAASAMQRKGHPTKKSKHDYDTKQRNVLRDELAALQKKQRRLDRHLSKIEALELEQMQRQAVERDPTNAAGGTTQYAIDQLREIEAEQQRAGILPAEPAQLDEAAQRKAFEDALRKTLDQDDGLDLRR